MAAATDPADERVSLDFTVEDGRTLIEVSGTQEAAVVVRSASGERVYLPPERSPDDGSDPYRPGDGDDSPYDPVPDDTPYSSTRTTQIEEGLSKTATGFRILHPEPVTDIRFLR